MVQRLGGVGEDVLIRFPWVRSEHGSRDFFFQGSGRVRILFFRPFFFGGVFLVFYQKEKQNQALWFLRSKNLFFFGDPWFTKLERWTFKFFPNQENQSNVLTKTIPKFWRNLTMKTSEKNSFKSMIQQIFFWWKKAKNEFLRNPNDDSFEISNLPHGPRNKEMLHMNFWGPFFWIIFFQWRTCRVTQ